MSRSFQNIFHLLLLYAIVRTIAIQKWNYFSISILFYDNNSLAIMKEKLRLPMKFATI